MEFNENCLRSLLHSDYARLVVWLVDNASEDGSAEWVGKNFPNVKVVFTGGNLGWSAGNNFCIRKALAEGAEYLWILNNDVEVEPDCITRLIARAEQADRPGIVGPLIYYFEPKNRVWFEGGEIDHEQLDADHCSFLRFESLPQERRYITGCALMVRREVFERIGLFDQRFFMYFEDTDFCSRAARAGYGIAVEQAATMYHKVSAFSGGAGGKSKGFKTYHMLRSSMLFWRKQHGFWRFHRRWCDGHLGKWVNDLPAWWADIGRRPAAEAIMDAVWYILTLRNVPLQRPRSPGWFRWLMRTRPWLVARWMSFRMR